MTIQHEQFKKLIILFWTAWWLIALWTDLVGFLAHHDLLKATWAPDLNYPFLAESLSIYNLPTWFIELLFFGIIGWSLLSTLFFLWASAALHHEKNIWMQRAQLAFSVSLAYWMAFFIADQLVMKFDLEENHMVQGGFQLLTYLALFILP